MMQSLLQTGTQAPRRNFLRFMQKGGNEAAAAPAVAEVGREEFQMLRQDMTEMKNSIRQLVQQRQTAPATPPEEDPRRRRMREMAD